MKLECDQVLKMTPVNYWVVLASGLIVSRAQEDFGEDMDQMDDPVDLESLTEGSKRSSQHQSNAKALGEEASYGEQTVLALQQLGLVLGPADNLLLGYILCIYANRSQSIFKSI